jgi:hypothetical protein
MSDKTSHWNPEKDKFYSEICFKIRATDDISFKLLGFVPILSGTGIFLLLFKGEAFSFASVVLSCLIGMTITIGLFLWERRNIKICEIFRDAAAILEQEVVHDIPRPYSLTSKPNHQEFKIDPDKDYSSFVGKTEAEVIIYLASALAWLIPIINLKC